MFQSILLVAAVTIIITLITYIDRTDLPKREIAILDKDMTQIYRGIAIILVMIQHCSGVLGTNIFTPWGGVGVAIFLLLSGFGLTESFLRKGMKDFLKGRLWRVWLPFALFYVGIHLLYEDTDCYKTLLNICSIRQDDYWYVHYMLRCYFIFWVSFRFLYKYRWIMLVAFALYTFFYMDGIRAEQCISFQLGILISEHKDKLAALHKRRLIWIMILFSITGITSLAIKRLPLVREMAGTIVYSFVQTCIKLPLAIAVVLALWMLPHKWIINNSVLILCGTLSYELYLIHVQLVGLVHNYISAIIMLFISGLIAFSLQTYLKRIQRVALK